MTQIVARDLIHNEILRKKAFPFQLRSSLKFFFFLIARKKSLKIPKG